MYIAAQCQSLLGDFPTTIEQDEGLLQQVCLEHATQLKTLTDRIGGNHEDNASSVRPGHQHLAVSYRLARKRLLSAAITDLQSMANLLDAT